MKIKSIKAREILDSRGNPTVEVELKIENGVFVDSVPSGASTGKYEAVELRDGGKRYQGKGVLKAVNNVNKVIAPKLIGKDPTRQREIDELMIKLDGTKNKSKLGANAVLAVSMTICRAGSAIKKIPLWKYISQISGNKKSSFPKPCFNIINGGAHASNDLDFQEFMIVPQQKVFSENLRAGTEIYKELKKIIEKKYLKLSVNVGDEGGFAPAIKTPEEALNLISEAIKNAGYKNKTRIILDVAASQFFHQEKYRTKMGDLNEKKLLDYYLKLIKKYPVVGLEDPFAEDDWEGWKLIMSNAKIKTSKLSIIGDDLLTTNQNRIKEAQKKKACNALILKINQIGTITEAINSWKLAKSFNWKIFVKHRSGETNDNFIADLAVGLSTFGIMAGAPARGERLAKYNRLLEIEKELK